MDMTRAHKGMISQGAQARACRFALGHEDVIEPAHLQDLSRLELFAVVAEHWLKCSGQARIFLLCSPDQFIRGQARAQQVAFTARPIGVERRQVSSHEQDLQAAFNPGV